MQIKPKLIFAPPESKFDEGLVQELTKYFYELASLLNGGIKFNDNLACAIVEVADTGVANTAFTVAHALKRIPIGFIMINTDKATSLYASGTAWTSTAIYLKSSVASCSIKVVVI